VNIRSHKSPKADVVAEASAWFVEFRAGDASAADRARFYEWLHRSPEHIQAYLEIAEGWAELPTDDSHGRLDLAAIVERARRSEDDENVVALMPRAARTHDEANGNRALATAARANGAARTSTRARLVGLATAAAICGLVMWLVLFAASTYRTGIGEQRTIRLADGSTIELNALSSVRVRLTDSARDIELEQGQALFHVAKDPQRPFIVRSGQTTVRAVGTQFDVYRKRTGTVVTVVEGKVAVAEPSAQGAGAQAPMLLTAGEQVTVPLERSPIAAKPKRSDVAAATAWVQKQLIFNDTPLAEVAEEFNRYSARRLVISDPELRSMEVSGIYSSTQPESFLGFLRAQPNLRIEESADEIRVELRREK
jgi:transmembrane sensor